MEVSLDLAVAQKEPNQKAIEGSIISFRMDGAREPSVILIETRDYSFKQS